MQITSLLSKTCEFLVEQKVNLSDIKLLINNALWVVKVFDALGTYETPKGVQKHTKKAK